MKLLNYQFHYHLIKSFQRDWEKNLFLLRHSYRFILTFQTDLFSETDNTCSKNFSAVQGEIRSPYFPDNYTGFMDCSYFITSEKGANISLNFLMFDTEFEEHCKYDYIQVCVLVHMIFQWYITSMSFINICVIRHQKVTQNSLSLKSCTFSHPNSNFICIINYWIVRFFYH